ncbi:polymer-forming cytoskeletal protein [Chitinophaga sp. XS-30]|uniref:bactofilin family protein n=1 Tax=Chitinophaga sp. XS-30 TaxID=2604421 RepID=UPI00143CF34D|nr:polymer-forming cytoskeletal protein [Chitinophaga sp. XS-30]
MSIFNFLKGQGPAKSFVLPREVTVSGGLEAAIPGRIEGRVNGDVRSTGQIVIGEEAVVRGHVYAPDVIIWGKVQGDVQVTNKAVICDKAHVKGDVTAMTMEIREGAVIEGAIRKDVLHPPAEIPGEPKPDPEETREPESDGQVNTWF